MTRTPYQHNTARRPNTLYVEDVGQDETGQRVAVEYYIPYLGVTHSSALIAQHFANRGFTGGEADRPWLEHESRALFNLCRSGVNRVVVAEGDLGAGKSTAVFGLRTLLREAGIPYVHIDGSYTRRFERLAGTIRRAGESGAVVIVESPDHWFMNSRANHQLNVKHGELVRETMVAAIQNVIDGGGQVVLTSHTAPWFAHNSTPELAAQFNDFLAANRAVRHRVYGQVPDAESLRYLAANIPTDDRATFAELYPSLATSSSESTAGTYRVAKLMGSMGIRLAELDQIGFDETVRAIDNSTRERMGAPRDYPLLPE